MVNLPIRKDYAPVNSSATSVLAVMNDMKVQQRSLSNMISQLNSLDSGFSDDLVDISDQVDNIISHTEEINNRILKQQQALSVIQSSSPTASADLIRTLNSEVSQMKNITSQVLTQSNNINSVISKGTNLGLPENDITKNLNATVENFSNKAQNLVSNLNSHVDVLNSVISNSQKSISGIITKDINVPNPSNTVQDMLTGGGLGDLPTQLGSFSDDVNIDMVKREVSQQFTDISDQVSGTLDNLKSSVTSAISSKITNPEDLKLVAGDLNSALENSTAGLSKLTGPINQLKGVSAQLDSITAGMDQSLSNITGDVTTGFKEQLSQINDITTSLDTMGTTFTSQLGEFSSTVETSIDSVGGFNNLTGAVGGVDSLTSITDPASNLSATAAEMSTLGRNLMTSAGSLNLYADGLPADNPISQLSNQLINIGEKVYNTTVDTPASLQSLATVSTNPDLNLASIEKSITNTGSALTSKPIPNVSLNVDVDNMVSDLTKQILAINNKSSSSL